MTAEF